MIGLDNDGVEEMRSILLNLRKEGKTILLVSHNSEDINVLCDKIFEMEHGKLRERAE